VAARVRAPARPGRFRLQLDLVHEGVTWFSQRGDPGFELTVDVTETGARRADDTLRFESTAAAAAAAAASSAAAAAASSEVSRPRLWRGAVAAFREHPLLGLGPDNFRHAHGRYVGLGAGAPVDDRMHANSWFFETLANLGLCGVAALAFVAASFWRTGRRALTRHGRSSPESFLAFGISAALGAYLIHGLFDYFLEFTPTYALLWLLAGMLAALADGPQNAGPEYNRLSDDELPSSWLLAGGPGPSQGPEYK
jgi:O-antigen ligase